MPSVVFLSHRDLKQLFSQSVNRLFFFFQAKMSFQFQFQRLNWENVLLSFVLCDFCVFLGVGLWGQNKTFDDVTIGFWETRDGQFSIFILHFID